MEVTIRQDQGETVRVRTRAEGQMPSERRDALVRAIKLACGLIGIKVKIDGAVQG